MTRSPPACRHGLCNLCLPGQQTGPNGQVLTKVLIIQDNYKEAFNQIEMAKDPWKNMGND